MGESAGERAQELIHSASQRLRQRKCARTCPHADAWRFRVGTEPPCVSMRADVKNFAIEPCYWSRLFSGGDSGAIRGRQAGILFDIVARQELSSVPREIFRDVAAVLEGVHDVVEVGRMIETQCVARFVQTGQIDDGVAQQRVLHSFGGDADVDYLSHCFPIKARGGGGPDHLNLRTLTVLGFDEMKAAFGSGLPGGEGPARQLWIARATT